MEIVYIVIIKLFTFLTVLSFCSYETFASVPITIHCIMTGIHLQKASTDLFALAQIFQ